MPAFGLCMIVLLCLLVLLLVILWGDIGFERRIRSDMTEINEAIKAAEEEENGTEAFHNSAIAARKLAWKRGATAKPARLTSNPRAGLIPSEYTFSGQMSNFSSVKSKADKAADAIKTPRLMAAAIRNMNDDHFNISTGAIPKDLYPSDYPDPISFGELDESIKNGKLRRQLIPRISTKNITFSKIRR